MYKLLIVDDEAFIRRGIKNLIYMPDLSIGDVFEAANGEEGLEMVKLHSPDIILADINMPIMNGLEFAAEARKMLPHAKIAMITGYDYFDYAVTALKAGVDDYILKPVSKDDISQLLKKLVQKLHDELSDIKRMDIADDISTVGTESSDDSYKYRIDASLKENLSNTQYGLGQLADELGLSTGYLSSKFRDIYGLNFQDYIVKMRIARAKLLLLSTNLKMYEVAEQTGFDDPNYFSASFKRNTGMSPSKFRKDVGAK